MGRQDASPLAVPGRVGVRPTENCAQPAEGQHACRRAQTGRFVCAVPGVPIGVRLWAGSQGLLGTCAPPGQLGGQGAG